jgi:hypothetical protein
MKDFTDLSENRVCIPVLLQNFPKRKLEDGIWKRVKDCEVKTVKTSLIQRLRTLLGA